MLVVTRKIGAAPRCDGELRLGFDERQKSRLRARLVSGEEIGIFLDRGEVLRGGDCLQGEDGRCVCVIAADEALMEVRAADAATLARAAYHLGNRHTPVQVGEGWLRFAADHVLGDMLKGMGIDVRDLSAAFEPEAGAYAAGHRHAEIATHSGVIHDFATKSKE